MNVYNCQIWQRGVLKTLCVRLLPGLSAPWLLLRHKHPVESNHSVELRYAATYNWQLTWIPSSGFTEWYIYIYIYICFSVIQCKPVCQQCSRNWSRSQYNVTWLPGSCLCLVATIPWSHCTFWFVCCLVGAVLQLQQFLKAQHGSCALQQHKFECDSEIQCKPAVPNPKVTSNSNSRLSCHCWYRCSTSSKYVLKRETFIAAQSPCMGMGMHMGMVFLRNMSRSIITIGAEAENKMVDQARHCCLNSEQVA